jgi:hypothetical protein
MSWHFSRALAVDYWRVCYSNGGLFAQWRLTDIPGLPYTLDKTMAGFHLSI